MPIPVTCPSCATTLKAPDSAAGRKVKCPKCGNPFPVPNPGAEPPAMVSAAPPAPRRAAPPPPPEDDYVDDEPRPRGRRPRDDAYSPGPQGTGTGLQMGLGIASLSLGACTLLVAWNPCLAPFSWPVGAVGLILGVVGLIIAFTRGSRGLAFPIAGSATSLVALGLALYWVFWWQRAASDVNDLAKGFQKAAQQAQNQAQQQMAEQLKQQLEMQAKMPGPNPQAVQQMPPTGAINLNGPREQVDAALTDGDPVDPMRRALPGNQGAPCKIYTVNLAPGKNYQIDLISKQFDAYLRLFNPQGQQVAFNDDFMGRNSRITYSCNDGGQYRIMATCLWPTFGPYGRTGDFTLIVNQK